jgi:hypothetical protein
LRGRMREGEGSSLFFFGIWTRVFLWKIGTGEER